MSDQISGHFITAGCPQPAPSHILAWAVCNQPSVFATETPLLISNNSTGKKECFMQNPRCFTDKGVRGTLWGAGWVKAALQIPIPLCAASSCFQLGFQFHTAAGAILDLPPWWVVSQLGPPRHSQAFGKGGKHKMMLLLQNPHCFGGENFIKQHLRPAQLIRPTLSRS